MISRQVQHKISLLIDGERKREKRGGKGKGKTSCDSWRTFPPARLKSKANCCSCGKRFSVFVWAFDCNGISRLWVASWCHWPNESVSGLFNSWNPWRNEKRGTWTWEMCESIENAVTDCWGYFKGVETWVKYVLSILNNVCCFWVFGLFLYS